MSSAQITKSEPVTEQHYSIPLIYLSPQNDQKFMLNPKAIQLIRSYKQTSMSFISICGQYRSGKSFLMNSLFFSKEGFKVSPTTEPCTKGINLWSKPIVWNGKSVWVLDTEGFGAIDRDDNYDVKIFLLATLISDVMMYNSFGALDQNSINKLAAICLKSQSMDSSLTKLKLFWLLRDFSLTMQTKQGKVLTADEYLSQSLDDSLTPNKQQRLAIKKVFSERHCIPLVRPVIEESVLSRLNEIKFQELRGEFVEEIYKLRKKMLGVVEVKYIQGVKLNTENLGEFLERYIEVLNSGEVQTNVKATWQRIVEYEKEKQESRIKSSLRTFIKDKQQKLPLTLQIIEKTQQQGNQKIEQTMREFKKSFSSQVIIKETEKQVRRYFNELMQEMKRKNTELINSEQRDTLKALFESLVNETKGKEGLMDGQGMHKFLERVFKTKEEYFGKFSKYVQSNGKSQERSSKDESICLLPLSTKLLFYQHFYQSQLSLLPKIFGQFSQQVAQCLIKLNQSKKQQKRLQSQLKQLKQTQFSRQSSQKQLTRQLSSLQIKIKQLEKQLQLKEHQMQVQRVRGQNELMNCRQEYEESVEELKQTILNLEKEFITVKKQTELEKTSYEDKVKFLQEKNQLITQKLQQQKSLSDKSLQQLKQQYQQKLKSQQHNYQQLLNQLNQQRKKFSELNKTKKEEESQLLQDLAQKNQKLLTLRREFVNIEHSYREQVDSLLKEQGEVLRQEFLVQLQEKQHTLLVYEKQLEQVMVRVKELELVQQQYERVLVEWGMLKEEHDVLVGKYAEVVNRLKRTSENQEESHQIIAQLKSRFQRDLEAKQQLLKSLKAQLKSSEQANSNLIQELTLKHQKQLEQIKTKAESSQEQKFNAKISTLEANHKEEKSQLLNKLKQSFKEIQELKSVEVKLESDRIYAEEAIKRVMDQYRNTEKQVKWIVKKYNKLQKEQQENNDLLNQNVQSNMNPNEISTLTTTQEQPSYQNFSQLISSFQSLITGSFQLRKSLTEQQQDLKYTFKQTITQLQQCEKHISELNRQIKAQEVVIKALDQQVVELKNENHGLTQAKDKFRELEKENALLKKQVEIRDDIYSKREQSIKENVQLYKETISNLTLENNHLTQKCNQLQIQLNQFTHWQADFISSKSTPSFPSQQFFDQFNQQEPQAIFNKLISLQKQNKKLRKQLYQQKQLILQEQSNAKSQTLLSNILQDTNSNQIIESTKKENLMYKKRIEQLRERELKLIEEVKQVKISEKSFWEGKIVQVKQEFEGYRKKSKDEIMQLQRKIDELTQEKYKIRQQMLLMRQQDRGTLNMNRDANNSNKTTQLSSKPQQPRNPSQTQQIERLKQQNQRLKSQITALNQQLTKVINESDKKLASLQLSSQQKIQKVQKQRSRLELQNQKNKTKYEHLLKVNNDLMLEVDSFRARANNQMTLKEKYKSKITALFKDDQ